MLGVLLDHEVIDDEEDVVDVELEALDGERAALLRVILGLEQAVEHVVGADGVLGLLAVGGDALVDLVGEGVLGARHALDERRDDDEGARQVLAHESGELLDALDGGERGARLEQVLVAHVQHDHRGLDRVVHLERVAQVVDGVAAQELDRLELLRRRVRERLAVAIAGSWLLCRACGLGRGAVVGFVAGSSSSSVSVTSVASVMVRVALVGGRCGGSGGGGGGGGSGSFARVLVSDAGGDHVVLHVAVEGSQLLVADDVADDEQVGVQAERQLHARAAQPLAGRRGRGRRLGCA